MSALPVECVRYLLFALLFLGSENSQIEANIINLDSTLTFVNRVKMSQSFDS